MMIKNNNKKNNGFTLAELMTSVAIFSIISMILFVTFSSGQKYLATSTSKLDSERGINIATQDINFSIRNGSLSNTNILSNADGTGYIVTSSASIYDIEHNNIINNDLSYNISGTSSSLNWNFNIVYFTAKLSNCQKCDELGLKSSICPHKYLIKRYYTLNNTYSNFLKWSDIEEEWKAKLSELIDSPYSDTVLEEVNNKYDKILARNVLAFTHQKNGKNVTYSIKLFKDYNIVKSSITEEKLKKSVNAVTTDLTSKTGLAIDKEITNSEENEADPLSYCTTQINYTAIPLNK